MTALGIRISDTFCGKTHCSSQKSVLLKKWEEDLYIYISDPRLDVTALLCSCVSLPPLTLDNMAFTA
ncbi:MAG TPA: hypothetical protein O0W88_04510 [Methanocorpusculum sp.]|nr:hypothetical protein [Methanocorpusculum sp.]